MATRSRRSQKYWAERKARELYENLIPVEEAAEDLRRLYFQASKEIENIIFHSDRGGSAEALEGFYSDENRRISLLCW